MSALKYLIQKEFIQFRRNKFMPRFIFLLPVLVMLIAPLVANMDVKGVRVALVDQDHSVTSQRIRSHLEASKYFTLRSNTASYDRAYALMEANKVDVILTLPAHYEQQLEQGTPLKVKVDANAVNATKGTLGAQYVVQTLAATLGELTAERGMTLSAVQSLISVQYLYNPTLDYRRYMAPAFLVILLLLICCFIPALNLVSEKEKGTIEQINVTPVSRIEFTLSKLIPYWLIGVVVLLEGILTVGIVYGLWPAGSWLGIFLAALIFALAVSGLGMAVANGSDNMQQCIFVLFFFVMIFMLMSGLFTPISSMPDWAQVCTWAFPTRHFIEIVRSLYLKGTAVAELGMNYLWLSIIAVVFCSIAALTYRKRS